MKSLDDKLKQLPAKRRSNISARAAELATLKVLRKLAELRGLQILRSR